MSDKKQTPDQMDLKKVALDLAVKVEGPQNGSKVLETAREYHDFLTDVGDEKLVPLEALKDTWKGQIKSGDVVKFTG